MVFSVEWIIDPPEHEWYYDADEDAITTTTTTVVHTFFHLCRMHRVDKLDVPLTPIVIPEAAPAPPQDPWDVLLSPLPDTEMEPMSPRLPFL